MNRHYFLYYLLLIILIGISFFNCKKTENTDSPVISVSQPLPGSAFENGDTIHFRASFSDNSQLTSINVQLMDQDNVPMLPVVSIVPDKKQYTFDGQYAINDPMLPGGTYQLRFQASNGVNVTNHFVQIQVYELQQKLLYPLIVTHPATSQWTVYKMDSSFQWKQIYIHTGDYAGSAINPAERQLYMCGDYQSDLTAVLLTNSTVVWRVKPTVYQSSHWFAGPVFSYPNLYVACAEGGVRAYNKNGTEVYKSDLFSNASPNKLVVTKSQVVASFTNAFSHQNTLVAFHNSGGLMVDNKYFAGDVVDLLRVESDKVLIFGNNNGHGEISLYDGAESTLTTLHLFPEGTFYKAIAIDSNNFMVSGSAGLYWYKMDNNSLTLYASAPINANIALDVVSQRIYTSTGKKLDVYDFPNPAILDSYNLPDTIVDLHLVYNK